MMNVRKGLEVLLLTTLLAACTEPTPQARAADSAENKNSIGPARRAAPPGKGLGVCNITMKQPEQHAWKTLWDPARTRVASKNPTRVRSVHWANESERAAAERSDVAVPFELVCGGEQGDRPAIAVDIVTYASKPSDVPLAPGTYPIVAKGGPGKPGQFIVGELLFGGAIFVGKSGTLKLERFDGAGAKGSFTIVGEELLTGRRPVEIEGSFDLPCQRERLQSSCKSDDRDAPR
jgi:hypothetical protein